MFGRNRVAALMVATTVVFTCVFAVTAFAGGSFTWDAKFNSTLRSRNYSTPNVGNHKIKSRMHNPAPGIVSNKYSIEVVRNRTALPDFGYGEQPCSANHGYQTRKWTNIDKSGTFHFDLRRDTIGGPSFDGDGRTTYP